MYIVDVFAGISSILIDKLHAVFWKFFLLLLLNARKLHF